MLASGLLALFVAGIFVALFTMIDEQRSAERARDREELVVAQVNLVQKLTLDLETGQRGFVITGQGRFLEPWRRARSVYARELATLVRLARATEDAPDLLLAIELRGSGSAYLSKYVDPLVAAARRSPVAARKRVLLGDGKRRVDGIRSLAGRLIAEEGREAREHAARANAAEHRSIAVGGIGLGGALLVIVIFAAYVVRAVVRPVRNVAGAADRLSTGDLARRVPVSGPREVAQLGQSFNDMATSLEHGDDERAQAEQALRDSEARLQAIMENSTAVIVVKDLDGRYVLLNRRFEELFGLSAEEAKGKTSRDIFGDQVADPLRANDRRVLEASGPIEAEEVVPHEDGDHTYLSTKFPLRDPVSGSVYAICAMSTDITERKRAEQAVEEARQQAESANQAKSRFLSRMSHELRTPLNAILGFGQLLELDELDRTQRENVDQILKGGRHLLALINEVLEISRIEAGEMPMSMEPVDVGLALTEVMQLMGPLAAERGLEVEVVVDDAAPEFVQADYQRLRQVLLNLVSNATKYNRLDGRISVSVEAAGRDGVRIAVSDTGDGIAADQLPKLFSPFERLDADSQEVEGSGLGLALSKRLVEAMDGSIEVHTEAGTGSTFSVELRAAGRPDATPAVEPPGEPQRTPSHDGSHRTVLCIEDNVSNIKLLERVFAHHPEVELLAAGQGTLGVDLARQHRPDLILLDLNLPDISGEAVLRQLYEDEQTSGIPVVVLSADATERQIARLLALGARDYLTKPFDVRGLLEVVQTSLNGSPRGD